MEFDDPEVDDDNVCPNCGLDSHCTKENGCWCMEYGITDQQFNRIAMYGGSCLCEDCLKEEIKQ